MPPAERLLPLLATWGVVPEIFTYWPEDDNQSPVALVSPTDTMAAVLRRGIIDALATIPASTTASPHADLMTCSTVRSGSDPR